MEIDLGSEVKINVKYAGKEYPLREPTVQEMEQMSNSEKESTGGVKAIVDLLEKIGMPRDVLMKMGMSQARRLVEGLTDTMTKKK